MNRFEKNIGIMLLTGISFFIGIFFVLMLPLVILSGITYSFGENICKDFNIKNFIKGSFSNIPFWHELVKFNFSIEKI